MKKIIIVIILVVILSCSFLIQNSDAQWVQGEFIGGGYVPSFAVLGNKIFAGTAGGIFVSTNGGANWTDSSLNNQRVNSLAVGGSNIYAGTGIYISDDITGNYTSGSGSVYFSTDNGTSWTQTELNNLTVFALTVSGNNIYAGTYEHGVFLSTNNGNNWTQTALNNEQVWSLASLGNNIFAGTGHTIFVTSNNGANWIQTFLNNTLVWSIVTHGDDLFAATDGSAVYLSTNNGASWAQTALNNQIVFTLAISENNIFAGTKRAGVFLSTNNGASWTQKNQGFVGYNKILALLIANNYIFAGTTGTPIWRRSYSEIIGIKQISELIPASYSLSQNYPNPFNPTTKIRYDLPRAGFVKLVVFDALGREVQTLVNERQAAGTYEAIFDGNGFASGVYLYRLAAAGYSETRKMLLIR